MTETDEDLQYRCRMAVAVADRLVRQHHLEPPIDVMGFCRDVVGLEVFEADLRDGICALLRRDLKAIAVNPREPNVRRRFSIAHELGHWYLHSDGAVKSERTVPLAAINQFRDREADSFAAAFLIPGKQVQNRVRSGTPPGIEELARAFEVSRESMWYRLNDLRLAHKILRA